MKLTILLDPSLVMHHYIFSLSDLCLKYRRNFKEILHFHPVIYIATPYHKKPCPVGHEIYYFVKPFFGPHYYALSLSHLCRRFSKKCIFTKSLIWSQTPAPGIMKFTILVDPSFVIITIHIVCLNQATEYRGSLINTSIYSFYTLITSLWVEMSWNLQFPVSLPYISNMV